MESELAAHDRPRKDLNGEKQPEQPGILTFHADGPRNIHSNRRRTKNRTLHRGRRKGTQGLGKETSEMNKGYSPISQQPPDREVEIIDDKGNTAIAIPTYYPFVVEKRPGDERKPWGWRGTIVPCDYHWDGGWLIEGDWGPCKIGKIVGWREIVK